MQVLCEIKNHCFFGWFKLFSQFEGSKLGEKAPQHVWLMRDTWCNPLTSWPCSCSARKAQLPDSWELGCWTLVLPTVSCCDTERVGLLWKIPQAALTTMYWVEWSSWLHPSGWCDTSVARSQQDEFGTQNTKCQTPAGVKLGKDLRSNTQWPKPCSEAFTKWMFIKRDPQECSAMAPKNPPQRKQLWKKAASWKKCSFPWCPVVKENEQNSLFVTEFEPLCVQNNILKKDATVDAQRSLHTSLPRAAARWNLNSTVCPSTVYRPSFVRWSALGFTTEIWPSVRQPYIFCPSSVDRLSDSRLKIEYDIRLEYEINFEVSRIPKSVGDYIVLATVPTEYFPVNNSTLDLVATRENVYVPDPRWSYRTKLLFKQSCWFEFPIDSESRASRNYYVDRPGNITTDVAILQSEISIVFDY